MIFGKKILIERSLYGYDICAEITLLKSDIHILLAGGSLPHTGAVSMYCDGKEDGEIQPSGHKDRVVSDNWSQKISKEFHCSVTTVCGIHYDNVTKDQIMQIVSVTEEMLEEAIGDIRKEKEHGAEESK